MPFHLNLFMKLGPIIRHVIANAIAFHIRKGSKKGAMLAEQFLRGALVIFVLTVGFLSASFPVFSRTDVQSHLSLQACNNCHAVEHEADAVQNKQLLASQEVLCGVCHKNLKRLSHPFGFIPTRALPTEFPLDAKGKMTCSTCHSIHGSQPGLRRGMRQGKDMCQACHSIEYFKAMQDVGTSLRESGHVLVDMNQVSQSGEIDALSLHCLGCHTSHAGTLNHPIGIAYPVDSQGYRIKSALPSEIWLPNNKVSCVSCHQAYSKVHGRLAMPINNGEAYLCAQCHEI